jgi:hypothetical protein
MSKINVNYSTEYILFMKNYLIKSCYTAYNATEHISYYENEQTNEMIWEQIFSQMSVLLTYYLHLSTNHQSLLPNHTNIVYSPSQLSTMYQYLSFQQFIDTKINAACTNHEYQIFVQNMKDVAFTNKLNHKYNEDTQMRILKNHIIYVIELFLSSQTKESMYFSTEESVILDTILDATPYFEFVSVNAYSNITNEDADPYVTHFKLLEKNVHNDVHFMLGQSI